MSLHEKGDFLGEVFSLYGKKYPSRKKRPYQFSKKRWEGLTKVQQLNILRSICPKLRIWRSDSIETQEPIPWCVLLSQTGITFIPFLETKEDFIELLRILYEENLEKYKEPQPATPRI